MIDFTPIIMQAFSALYYVLPLGLLIFIFKSAWFKGGIGEFQVNLAAKIKLNKNYHLIKNVTLPTKNGTTQIDHIIVSKFGIFVVETKNIKGWIYGSEQRKTWTKQVFKQKYSFQNPLHQNQKHIKTVSELLAIDEGKFFSVIVFVGNSTFKTPIPDNVTYASGYIRYIKSKTKVILSDFEVDTAIETIEKNRLTPSLKTNQKHIKYVKDTLKSKQNLERKNNICSKCGGTMIMRKAKKGANIGQSFWGCSNYPRCKNIMDISN